MKGLIIGSLAALLLAGYGYGMHVIPTAKPHAKHPIQTAPKHPIKRAPKKHVVKHPKKHNKHPQPIGPAMDTIRGTIKNGQLQTVVWAGLSPKGPLYPVALMVDTGAMHTMVSGNFFHAAGDTPTGQTSTFAGIGGNETVQYWPQVWVFPQDKGINPILAGATEPGGINRSALGPEGIIILLGQEVISSGTLTQMGDTWTLTYPVK